MRENRTLYRLLADHLGSTAVTANGTTGAKVAEVRYKAFGEDRYTFGTTPTTYRYTGQRREAALGLYFYNARWYDPFLGRFVQADTIVPEPGEPQGLNRFSYCLNNPLRRTDPTGHQPRDPIGYQPPVLEDTPDTNSKERISPPTGYKSPPFPPGGRTYSEEEMLALAHTMWGEEGAIGTTAMIAVGWVAVNRLLQWGYSDLVTTVSDVEFGVQFQGYWRSLPAEGADEYIVYQEASELARDLLSGEFADPTHGATYMGNYELGSEEHRAAQSWSTYFPKEYHFAIFGMVQ